MAKVLTGISGNLISAASAGFAPTNSADVSAIASAYQVVSATATQLYAGTAYVTSVNGAPLSASRAGNAANASLATSAWYDGTGRLISALPDSAAVSAIASAYAESAVSGKQDTLTFSYDDDKISAINGSALAGQGGGGGGGSVVSPSGTILVTDGSSIEATNSAVYLTPPGPLAVYTSAHPSVASAKYYGGTIYNCDDASGMPAEGIDVYMAKITNSNTKSASFTAYNTSWEEAWTGTASWNSANNMAQLRFGTLIDVVSLSWGNLGGNSYLSGSSTSNYSIQFLKTTQPTLVIGELAWASSLPTYGYDGNSAISSINGSAIAAGGTTAYVEKSAWAVAIGSNNTATMTSFAHGGYNNSVSESFVQGMSGYANNASFSQGGRNSANNESFSQGYRNTANLTSFAQGADNTALTLSFAAGTHNYAMNHSFVDGYYNSAVNSATAFGQYNLKNNGDTTGHSAAFVIGDGTASNARHDLMVVTKDGEITMYSSTADTTGTGIMSSIRALSANAGGVDSATCSAIASSYAESAVSSYQPLSGMSGYASAFSAGEGLEFVQSGSDQVLQVEAPVDIVAGPGIVIDNPDGNTLRVSVAQAEEVVLWSGTPTNSKTLTEPMWNFERIRIEFYDGVGQYSDPYGSPVYAEISVKTTSTHFNVQHTMLSDGNFGSDWEMHSIDSNGTGVTLSHMKRVLNGWSQGSFVFQTPTNSLITKIVGIHRINGGN